MHRAYVEAVHRANIEPCVEAQLIERQAFIEPCRVYGDDFTALSRTSHLNNFSPFAPFSLLIEDPVGIW